MKKVDGEAPCLENWSIVVEDDVKATLTAIGVDYSQWLRDKRPAILDAMRDMSDELASSGEALSSMSKPTTLSVYPVKGASCITMIASVWGDKGRTINRVRCFIRCLRRANEESFGE
jgi:hypothetical protein